MKNTKLILPLIVLSQFCCTSLWFAGNSVMGDLTIAFGIEETYLGSIISSVQLGFIVGTLLFAILTISDRFSPSKVFAVCAIFGAFSNFAIIWEGNTLFSVLTFRFLTGLFLAGIYPVGMKIAADYYQKGLGKSLGFLVGALVLGTAFPHLVKSIPGDIPWKSVLITTSSLAILGGLLMILFVPNGPFRKAGSKINPSTFFRVFKKRSFRSAAIGYFGHMWELYAFWAFVPVILETYVQMHPASNINISFMSFIVIAVGSLSCTIGGYVCQYVGVKRTAIYALFISCVCCLLSPFLFMSTSEFLFLGFLIIWGIAVIADSPMFSTLVAQNAPNESRGTALTIVNCIGFSITIISIQLLSTFITLYPTYIYTTLAVGPIIGLLVSRKKTHVY